MGSRALASFEMQGFFSSLRMRFLFMTSILACFMMIGMLSACDIIAPPDPPFEPKDLRPDDFAWDNLDITQQYEYIQVARIDCPKIQSVLTGSGKCVPVKLPFSAAVECPLSEPAQKLTFACVDDASSVPAVYARLEFGLSSNPIDMKKLLGDCQFVAAGPAIGQPQRYPTDQGFKACLFQKKATYSSLKGESNALRPAGMYLDFIQRTETPEQLKAQINANTFKPPIDIVMDARFLNDDERLKAFQDVNLIFQIYRQTVIPQTALK